MAKALSRARARAYSLKRRMPKFYIKKCERELSPIANDPRIYRAGNVLSLLCAGGGPFLSFCIISSRGAQL